MTFVYAKAFIIFVRTAKINFSFKIARIRTNPRHCRENEKGRIAQTQECRIGTLASMYKINKHYRNDEMFVMVTSSKFNVCYSMHIDKMRPYTSRTTLSHPFDSSM